MKRIIESLISATMVLILLFAGIGTAPVDIQAAESSEDTISRVINVVYDDSGSMIAADQGRGEYTDAWCKAQYSMEVFASMLGENDTMNIFLMSKFSAFSGKYPKNPEYATLSKGERAKKVVTLKGNESITQRVKDVQNLPCAAGNTPFATVKAAVYDFHDPDKGYAKDAEQWLVILTDGAFDDISDDVADEINAIKSSAYDIDGTKVDNSNLKIIFFGMQTNAELPVIKTNESKGIYSYTGDTKAIRSTITNICSRIFNRNKLEKVNVSAGTYSFDVPLSEMIVFEQAKDVDIAGVKLPDGSSINSSKSKTVTVKYTEEPYAADVTIDQRKTWYGTKGNNTWAIDRSLQGQIVTFTGHFQPGEYVLQATDQNAAGDDKTLEVYYSPDVTVAVVLAPTDPEAGNITYRIGVDNDIPEGEYELILALANGSTGEILQNPTMLGDVTKYSGDGSIQLAADFINNGRNLGTFTNAQKNIINLEKGECSVVEANASFCDGVNTATASDSSFTVLKKAIYISKGLSYEVGETPSLSIEGSGLKGEGEAFTITAKLDGANLTKEQWNAWPAGNVPKLSLTNSAPGISFDVERTETPGVFKAYPRVNVDQLTTADYTRADFEIVADTIKAEIEEVEYETWTGTGSGSVAITDKRNRSMSMSVVDTPLYQLDSGGLTNASSKIKVKVSIDGDTPTAEQWAGLNDISLATESSEKRVAIKYEKAEPGVIYVYPVLDKDGDGVLEEPTGSEYGNLDFKLTAAGKNGLEKYSSEVSGNVSISDNRSWFEKHKDLIIRLLTGGAILILILGYVFKRRLPKQLVGRPLIKASNVNTMESDKDDTGSFSKKRYSQFLPYIAERAVVRVTPRTAKHGCPPIVLKLKAVGGGKFKVTNEQKSYAGKYDFGYGGQPIAKGAKIRERSAGTFVSYKLENGWKFSCYLNQTLSVTGTNSKGKKKR